jgi:hypothetical protein
MPTNRLQGPVFRPPSATSAGALSQHDDGTERSTVIPSAARDLLFPGRSMGGDRLPLSRTDLVPH